MLSLSLLADQATWYPITFDSPLNIVRGVCFWLTVALILGFLVALLLIKGENRGTFLKTSLFGGVVYACAIGLVLLVMTYVEDGLTLILFLPLLILILCIAGSAVAVYKKPEKLILIVSGAVTGAALIATLVCMGVYFSTGKPAEDNWLANGDVNQIGLYISAVLFLAAVVAATLFLGRDEKNSFDSKSISYAGVAIAMSFALSYLRVVKMPQGGSITIASLLPIFIYSYMFGVKKGVFAGMILGLLQAVQDPVILHPAQFILDYPAAYACIGFAGVFAKVKKLDKLPQLQIALGGVCAGLARFLSHYLSGCFAFSVFAPEGQPVWLYSLIYQSGYVLPDIAIVIAVGVIVFSSPSFVKAVRKYWPKKNTAPAEAAAETAPEDQAV